MNARRVTAYTAIAVSAAAALLIATAAIMPPVPDNEYDRGAAAEQAELAFLDATADTDRLMIKTSAEYDNMHEADDAAHTAHLAAVTAQNDAVDAHRAAGRAEAAAIDAAAAAERDAIAAYNTAAGRGDGLAAELIAKDIDALQDIFSDWINTDNVQQHDLAIAEAQDREYDLEFELANDAIERSSHAIDRANDAWDAYMDARHAYMDARHAHEFGGGVEAAAYADKAAESSRDTWRAADLYTESVQRRTDKAETAAAMLGLSVDYADKRAAAAERAAAALADLDRPAAAAAERAAAAWMSAAAAWTSAAAANEYEAVSLAGASAAAERAAAAADKAVSDTRTVKSTANAWKNAVG